MGRGPLVADSASRACTRGPVGSGWPAGLEIASAVGISNQKAARWRKRFLEMGLAGLERDAFLPSCNHGYHWTVNRTLASFRLRPIKSFLEPHFCFLSLQVQRRNSMETRIFDRTTTVLSNNGKHTERFNSGERAKNIKRIVKRVMFEPASLHRVAGTYAMDWD